MKNVILYYSYTGHTKKLAEELAGKSGADLVEVKDCKRPGKLAAYTSGCLHALRMKGWEIDPAKPALDKYDGVIVLSPVWAGHPAPAVISLLAGIPAGKSVGVIMVSMSGASKAEEKLRALLERQGCTLKDYKDAKA